VKGLCGKLRCAPPDPIEDSMAKLSIRIDFVPEGRVGPGKIELLERIAEYGSISAAGRSMNMSYRRAWELVANLNRAFSGKVVEAHIGGRHGGQAVLTELGKEVVSRYRAAETNASRAATKHLEALQAFAGKPRRKNK
jgi:molybdate transport system regulatory protein